MSYILTSGGRHFDPVDPDESLLDITDIAHALAYLCRANGHFKRFYSVAQHSMACAEEAEARGYSREVVLGCLLHDASEAYLSDVTRPVKADLPWYLEVEDRLQDLIWHHYIGRGLTEKEKKQVFGIDDERLSMEFRLLMPEELDDGWKRLVKENECPPEVPEEAAERFLKMFERLTSEA